ncbi:MAG: hypothetical protein ABIS18_08955 [Actinomycetota bacterium]
MESTELAGGPTRMLTKASVIGGLAAVIGLGLSGYHAATGAFAGSVVAGLYASGYLRSHIAKAGSRQRIFDAKIARDAVLRLVVAVAVGVGAHLFGGRIMVKAYVGSFAVAFALLVISEIPRAKQDLRARGVIG